MTLSYHPTSCVSTVNDHLYINRIFYTDKSLAQKLFTVHSFKFPALICSLALTYAIGWFVGNVQDPVITRGSSQHLITAVLAAVR